jgi:hypothetical protein
VNRRSASCVLISTETSVTQQFVQSGAAKTVSPSRHTICDARRKSPFCQASCFSQGNEQAIPLRNGFFHPQHNGSRAHRYLH